MSISYVASCIMDLTFEVGQFPEAGDTVLTEDFHTGFGGKGANQAVAGSLSGGDVRVTGAVGADNFGDRTIQNFRDQNIDVERLFQLSEAGTGLASIFVDETGENLISVAPRANAEFSEEHVEQIPNDWFEVDYVGGVLETPQGALTKCFRKAKHQHGSTIVLNAAPPQPISPDLWSLVDVLIVNENELHNYEKITKGDEVDIARDLVDRGLQRVIVTLGERGSFAVEQSEVIESPGVTADAVDTTGAGDAFVGSYIAARDLGKSVRESLDRANQYAAASVEREGTQKSYVNNT